MIIAFQYIYATFNNAQLGSLVSFKFEEFEDFYGFIELDMHAANDDYTAYDTKGWSVLPHEFPTRVSMYIILHCFEQT